MERLEQKCAAPNPTMWGSDIYHTCFKVKIHITFQIDVRYAAVQYEEETVLPARSLQIRFI